MDILTRGADVDKIKNKLHFCGSRNKGFFFFSKFLLDKFQNISYFKYNNCTITNSTVKTGTTLKRTMAKKLTCGVVPSDPRQENKLLLTKNKTGGD
jgi:hypothetical protein